MLRPCEAVQNLFVPTETENHSLKSHSQPRFLYQLEQDCGIKASNKVGRDAFYKKRFSRRWLSPRRIGPLPAFLNARRDLKPQLPKSFSVEMPREMIPLLLPPDFVFIPLEFRWWVKLQETSGQPRLAGGIAEHFGMTKRPFLMSPGKAEAEESSSSCL